VRQRRLVAALSAVNHNDAISPAAADGAVCHSVRTAVNSTATATATVRCIQPTDHHLG
jgi:hypothetical protein